MVTIILHTHIPWVLKHGTWPHGSDWLCEAVAECYLPLLRMCRGLVADGIRPGITFGFSPVLCEQLRHPDFPELFTKFCENHIELLNADVDAFSGDESQSVMKDIALYWIDWYNKAAEDFSNVFESDVIGAFARLQQEDAIAIITCGATHGYLPLLAEEASVDLQIRIARDYYMNVFGRAPRGIWLPECAYRPGYEWRTLLPVNIYSTARKREGIETFLSRYNLECFVIDQPVLDKSVPLGVDVQGKYRIPFHEASSRTRAMLDERSPYDIFKAGSTSRPETAAIFTRNLPISLQVWSSEMGYPGDPLYLDFHKKHYASGIRYWQVTDTKGDMADKTLYNPEAARSKAVDHARHYAQVLSIAGHHRLAISGGDCTICLPFDTELFGHWWFEGPVFLEALLRELHAKGDTPVSTVHDRLDAVQPRCVVAVPESSWGRNNTDEVWMNPDTEWTWKREYQLEYRMRMLFEKHISREWDGTMTELMVNALRQMMLAQASDWQFLITNFSAREYATARFHNHASDAERLCTTAELYATTGKVSEEDSIHLQTCASRDGIFTAELYAYVAANMEKPE